MSDRKAELERKKKKLQEIREEKERRQRERAQKEAEDAASRNAGRPGKDIHQETDDMLSSLGIAPPSEVASLLSTMSSTSASELNSLSSSDITLPASTLTPIRSAGKKQPMLSVINVQVTDIPPKEQISYNKQTQTTGQSNLEREGSDASSSSKEFDWWRTRKAHPVDYYVLQYSPSTSRRSRRQDGLIVCPTLEWDDEFPVLVYDNMPGDDDEASSLPPMDSSPPIYHGKMPHIEMVKPVQTAIDQVDGGKQEEMEEELRELSEEEKQKIMMTDEFHRFFNKTSRIIERALYENFDIAIDYSYSGGEEREGDDKSGLKLSQNRCFYDERWSKYRTVTCLDWSTQHPELLVASYNNNEDFPHDPDGVVLVWNMKFKKNTPEYIFHCQSPVMSTCFAKFHPNLIVGGTYSGQIVLWDNRTHKRTPIQRSPLSTSAHTHPVYCVKVVGTQNAHNLISISTDGKMCAWSLDMLSMPQDSMELQYKQSKAVAVTCLSFPAGDVNNFVVGSEEGTVHTACRHGSKAGLTDIFEGHQGPVTGIDTHNAQGQVDFSHLFLTSSFDWTIKLWSLKENKPLYSFEDNGDYVYDVSWSPINPAVFAAVDGMGRLDLWNLNNDTEAPTASVVVDGCPALNRVSWAQSGCQVVTGDDMGKVWVYDVGEQLALPRNDEWSKFAQTLQDLKNNQGDEDLDGGSLTTASLATLASSPLR